MNGVPPGFVSFARNTSRAGWLGLALIALMALVNAPCRADVAAPTAPPPVPADFCGSLYTELNGDLQAFNAQLAVPPTWTPVSNAPTVYAAALPWANSNTGPQLSSPVYLQTVLAQLQQVKALGVEMVSIPILFPILYEPFFGSQAAMQPYLSFYQSVAQAARAAGLKVMVDDEILFSNDIQAGWSNTGAFYSSLSWPDYMAARATMAATIAQYIQPDFLVLANEPDTEAVQTGQSNLNIPADAAQMVAAEIAAVQALNLPNPPKLGAGFGTWMPMTGTTSLLNYTNAYVALPLDYIDYHLLPVITVNKDNFAANALTVASLAAAAGKPVAVGQAWLSKVAASEEAGGYNVSRLDVQRSRQSFSFWQPLDAFYLQVMQNLANYQHMLYLDLEQTFYLGAYQTYGGTVANGGAATCTCTTATCSDYDIMQTEVTQANTADQAGVYTAVAAAFYHQLVTTPDTTPPTAPGALAATAGTTGAQLSWGASTDNVGVAGYNVFRCTPPAAGQPCTETWIANATLPAYYDSTLTSNTLYTYQVQAFDFVNNTSALSPTLTVLTYRTSADAATNLAAQAVSAQEIDLSWSPPTNATGLGEYLILGGTSPANLQQIAVAPATATTYRNQPLSPATTYYYGVVAKEEGIAAPMTPLASATTLPLPNPPTHVTATATPTSIALTWQENAQPGGLPINFYQVYQGTTSGSLTKVASTTATKYTATSLSPGTTYYFAINAADTGHDISMLSDQVSVTTLPMPTAPVNVAAVAISTTQVTVSWSYSNPPSGLAYYVFRGTAPSSLTQVAATSGTSYTDRSLTAGTTYYYAVEAFEAGCISPMSAVAPVTTLALPAAPVNLAATAVSTKEMSLSWAAGPSGMPVAGYYVFRGTTASSLAKVAVTTATTWNDYPLKPGTTYYYAVEEKDSIGDVSPMSTVVAGTTKPAP